ncbi:unnamed protein product [Clonostachys chloroleuca]|uniref:Uncharacterized protein n=1 Tax=Clonostachys chloroleuca TaxID=1926264 RepID=A0AA35MFG4_9HYPO|nr:unnamed protein product [Clonostachys chloroleuca]
MSGHWEFITWHLLGHDAIDEKFCLKEDGQIRELQGFRTLRNLEDAADDGFLEDAFFNQGDDNQAYLKKSVPRWCSHLRGSKSCSSQLCDFINFFQNHMLVVELDKRKRIDFVCTELDKILKDKNSGPISPFAKGMGDFPPLFTQDASYSVQIQSGFHLLMVVLDYPNLRNT